MWRASAIQDENSPKIIEEIPAPMIKYLVFEGGGIRGIAYAGVVQELEEANLLSHIEHVAGSSIGSVAALLLALGCTSEEIKDLLGNLSFEDFLEGQKPWPITPGLITKGKQYLTILTSHSLSSGDRFLAWIEKILEKKLGKKNATFADLAKLAEKTGENKYKYLSVTGSNVSKNRLEVFDHETTPDMPIALAVRISASFPGVFRAVPVVSKEELKVEIKTSEGIVKETIVEDVINLYVDGGLMNNLPSFIFGDKKYLPEGVGFNEKGANPSILNIKVDTDEEIRQLLWNNGQPKIVNGIKDYSKKLLDGMQSRDTEIYQQYSTNTIQVHDCGIDTLKFNITDIENKKLMTAGREAAIQWLETHVSEAYKIHVYKNQADWLSKKSLEEMVQIRSAYQEQLKEVESLKTTLNSSQSDRDVEIIVKNLKNKILWFEQYLQYRFNQLLHPDESIFHFIPHVNIKPIKPRENCDEYVKDSMANKLARVEAEITLLEPKIKDIFVRIEVHYSNQLHLHDLMTFDLIVYLTKLEERLKWLKEIRFDLLNKLKHKSGKENSNDIKCNANERFLFHTKIKSRLAKKDFYLSPHINLINFLDKHLYQSFASYLTEEGVKASLDLRSIQDFKLYLMACFMYLKFVNSNDPLVNDVQFVYKALFSSEAVPINLHELGAKLNQQDAELLLSAYRIEGLIKNFMRVEKKNDKSPVIDLDYIFTALAPSKKKIFAKKKVAEPEEPNDFELDFVYQPFSHERSDKFLMFHRTSPINLSTQPDFENQSPQINLKNSEGEKNKLPKCLRRLESN